MDEAVQSLVLVVDDDVGTERDTLVGQVAHAVADEHRDDPFVVLALADVPVVVVVHQLAGLPEHLLRHREEVPGLRLAVDPHVAVLAARQRPDVALVGGRVVEVRVFLLGRQSLFIVLRCALRVFFGLGQRLDALADEPFRAVSVLPGLLRVEQLP